MSRRGGAKRRGHRKQAKRACGGRLDRAVSAHGVALLKKNFRPHSAKAERITIVIKSANRPGESGSNMGLTSGGAGLGNCNCSGRAPSSRNKTYPPPTRP